MKYIVTKVGNLLIGGDNPLVIQTMCNTPTADIEASVSQCRELYKAGAQMIRLTTQGLKEVSALAEIKEILRSEGINIPLVADIHFTPDVAFEAAKVADKVRINPGNFSKDKQRAVEKFAELIKICNDHGTAIRIGVNHGSLDPDIVEKFGNSSFGMMQSALEWIALSESLGFERIVVSLKASNTIVMNEAYKLLYSEMVRKGTIYPLHLGVTEAGNGDMGRIKSAVGVSSLLKYGIGSTLRVSLTESPLRELPVARLISTHFSTLKDKDEKSNNYVIATNEWEKFIIDAACSIGPLLLERKIDDFTLEDPENYFSKEKKEEFRDMLLQASRRRFTRPEYIACPGCGRTLFKLEETFEEVKRRTAHLTGLNIAVMGCVVNGPGEMADADYGYVGEGRGKVSIYRGKEPVYKSVPQEDAIDVLLNLIENDKKLNIKTS
jgi:(E)-4-hydroxy-3-methylbut-2-enyl-diphosphate synthase